MQETHKSTDENQGGVQILDVFRDQPIVMIIGNFLVSGPEICRWVDLNLGGFPVLDRLFQSEIETRDDSVQEFSVANSEGG